MNPSKAFSILAIIVYLVGLLYCIVLKAFVALLLLPLLFLLEPILLSIITLTETIFEKKLLKDFSLIISVSWFFHVLIGLLINFEAISKTNEDYGIWRIIFLIFAIGHIYALKARNDKINNFTVRNILSFLFFLLFFLFPMEKNDKVILQSNPYGLFGFFIASALVILLTAKSTSTTYREIKFSKWLLNYGFPLFIWFFILIAIHTVYYKKKNIVFALLYPAMLAHLNNGIFFAIPQNKNQKLITLKQLSCYCFIIAASVLGFFVGSHLNYYDMFKSESKSTQEYEILSNKLDKSMEENSKLKKEVFETIKNDREIQSKQMDELIKKRLDNLLHDIQRDIKNAKTIINRNAGESANDSQRGLDKYSPRTIDWAAEGIRLKKAEAEAKADARKILEEYESTQKETLSPTDPQQNP